MAKLIYVMPTSLGGYIEDETGKFDWATPDKEGFAFINDLERPSARISTDAGCTRRWRSGRRQRSFLQTSFLVGRRPCWTSRRSGKRRTRSSIPNRWKLSLPRRRVSNGNSTRRQFAT